MSDTNSYQKKIPYGSNILINCPNCGLKGEPGKYREGRTLTEILLRLLFLLPGFIYSAWRHINTICICPKCGETYLEETDGDMDIVTRLIKIKKKQIIRFRVILICFFSLGAIFLYKEVNDIKEQYVNEYRKTVKEIMNYEKTYPNVNIVDEIKNPINNLTDPEKYNDWLNTVTESITPQEKVEENITPETNQEINQEINQEEKKEIKEETKEYKYTKEEVRKKMQDVLKEVDNQYSNTDSYIGTSCFGDCINGVINVNFSENIGRYDFTVKSHSAMLSNKIIEAIPGYFNQLRIRFIYKGQAVCSCTFTEYQTNIMIPKGCTYLGYKE